jgi:hypothetical protein
MQVAIQTKRDGSMHLRLDEEAAKAMLASVRFASRFHAGIASLAKITEERLQANEG